MFFYNDKRSIQALIIIIKKTNRIKHLERIQKLLYEMIVNLLISIFATSK